MRNLKVFFLLALVALFWSCSDDDSTITGPFGPDCFLVATTDSSTKYTEITYWNDNVLKLHSYSFSNGEKGGLLSSVEYDRNFLDDFKSIKVFNGTGNLERVDSISYNSKGLIYEIITYNNKYERLERVTLAYDNLNNLIEERVFKFDINWIIKIETKYIYDSENRVTTSVRNQKTTDGSLIDSSFYTYDNMNNIEYTTKLYTPFKKNNFLSVENIYYLNSGQRITETLLYEYEYNEKGYPIKTKITSSIPENGIKYQHNTINCTD
ncbi:MAG: hypothetical protein CVV25_05565 [Ignavibacteriae bacterium HGW-Ignavibacteriae-4]|jgi:hypothetical protein|nr:MAG: hypothetical protein CVV25_05565 [Ignavibacteriae bacterium HGW-Ignavibacteriae-4]